MFVFTVGTLLTHSYSIVVAIFRALISLPTYTANQWQPIQYGIKMTTRNEFQVVQIDQNEQVDEQVFEP